MSTNTVDPAQPTPSTVVVATDGSVTVTQVSNATTVTYPGVFATPFSPLDLSPTLWLDASDETTITESGGAVSQWDDKSGNGYDLIQTVSSTQPLTGTATINGLNTIEYATTARTMYNVAFPKSTLYTMFAVYEINSSDTSFFTTQMLDSSAYIYAAQSGSSSTNINAASISNTSLYVDGVEFSGTTQDDVYTAIGNAPAVLRLTFQSNTYASIRFGSHISPWFFDSGTKVAEVIICESPSAQEISDTETYLADKWGITL